MRKPIVKFMAGTLAAAMVVTSPITVFAGNDGFLSHIFSSNRLQPDSETKTGTKTVTLENGTKVDVTWDEEFGTKSISNTGTLDDVENVPKDVTVDDYILGVEFDQDEINVIAGGDKQTLKAMVYTSNGKILSSDKLKGVLSFRKLQLAAEGQDLTSAKVGYAYDATAGGMGAVARDTLEIRGEHGGAFVIEARLDTNKDGKYEFTKRIPVFVKEYTKGLKINAPGNIYLKNTYNLSVTRYSVSDPKKMSDDTVSKTANDTITWTAYTVDTTKSNKVGKATSYLTIKEDGTLVLKKDLAKIKASAFDKGIDIYVQAVGEKGAKDTFKLNDSIKEAKPVKTLTDSVTKKNSDKKTIGWGREKNATTDLVSSWEVTVVPDPADTTDQITWTVKNPAIVSISNTTGLSNTITPLKVGKTTVTAQAASGKKVTYTVTVKAPLVSIDGVVKAGTKEKSAKIYVGQTIQLQALLNPAQSTDGIKFVASKVEVDGKLKDLVSINNKTGVVTTKVVKNRAKQVVGGTVTIKATGKRVSDNTAIESPEAEVFTLEVKAPVIEDTKLNVYSPKSAALKTFVQKTNNLSNANDTLYVGKDTTYTITGDKAKEDGTQALTDLRNSLSWTSNKLGIATVNNGKTDAISSGKANVTATVVNKEGKKLTAKVAVTSKQAVQRLQLSKTEITLNPSTKAGKPVTTSIKVSKQLPAKCAKENVKWTIEGHCKEANAKFELKSGKAVGSEIASDLKKTSVTIQATNVQVGDYAIVTAEAENGAVATAMVRVLEKTSSVKFITDVSKLKSTVAKADLTINAGDPFKYNLNDLVAVATKSGKTEVGHRVAGKEVVTDKQKEEAARYESVTFTANKAGIVTITEAGEVYGIKAGKVTITAKTPSGKSAKITITVK